MHIFRSKLVAPLAVLILTIGAIAAVWLLVDRASESREAQLRVATMKLSLANLGDAPFSADPSSGGSAAVSRSEIQADESALARGLASGTQPGVSSSLVAEGRSSLTAVEPVVEAIYRTALEKGGLAGAGRRVPQLQGLLVDYSRSLTRALSEMGRADAGRASTSRTRTKLGATGAMVLLLIAFAYFYFRSVTTREAVERLVGEKEALLGTSRAEARTDALTDLGNRRALTRDMKALLAAPSEGHELLFAMFDLDGFKQYNDSFGHAAGDSLLQRLGVRLNAATAHVGGAYRMGGDEFSVLARCSPGVAEHLLEDASAALADTGESWHIGSSYGSAWIPSEAADESQALRLADERMYAQKTSRSTASRQVTDALLQVITEQNVFLDEHVERVSALAGTVAEALGEPEHAVWLVRLAARLHDVGKTAIPAAILDKPGPLDEREWEFMRRHPVIGERIVIAAPALSGAAPIIRSSHERVDGHGYPDGLAGDAIPLGSRIIAVCDAFDAMTSRRVYRPAMTVAAALDELERNAGTQFDPDVVRAFSEATELHHCAAEDHRSIAAPPRPRASTLHA